MTSTALVREVTVESLRPLCAGVDIASVRSRGAITGEVPGWNVRNSGGRDDEMAVASRAGFEQPRNSLPANLDTRGGADARPERTPVDRHQSKGLTLA